MADPLSFRIKKQFDRYIHDPIAAILAIPLFLILKNFTFQFIILSLRSLMCIVGPMTSYHGRIKKHMQIAFPKKIYY